VPKTLHRLMRGRTSVTTMLCKIPAFVQLIQQGCVLKE